MFTCLYVFVKTQTVQVKQVYCTAYKLYSIKCPTLCDPMDCSPPGSSVHGILQARILEWGAISSSRGSSRPRNRTQISCMAGKFFAIRATRQVKFILKMSNMGIQKHRQNLESLPLCPLLLLPVSFLCLSQGADISLSSVSSAPPNTQ